MTTFQFRPLLLWDRPETDPRSSSARFRAFWDDTVLMLRTEAEHLGAQAIAVQVDADESQIRRDGMLRSAARVGHPGVKVAFDSDFGPLTYATDQYDHWKANVRAIALGLQALRAVDRYGISKSGEQYRGYAAITSSKADYSDLTVLDAVTVFRDALKDVDGMTVDGAVQYDLTTRQHINSAYRIASRRYHPDVPRTGDEGVFRLLTAARDVLLASASL